MSSSPTFIAYAVKERGKGKKSFWTRIGSAWAHKNGGGFNLELEALPVDGKIILMPPKAQDAAEISEGEGA
jgi:hypothetical protein